MASVADLIVGTWELRSCQSFTGDGHELPDMLAEARGVIMYQDCGLMSAQIITPALLTGRPEYKNYPIQPPFDSIPDSIARLSLENFVSYFATYSLDIEQQIVIHKIQGSNLPHYIHQSLKRHYQFINEDHLILETRLGELTTQPEKFYRQLHWQRITTSRSL